MEYDSLLSKLRVVMKEHELAGGNEHIERFFMVRKNLLDDYYRDPHVNARISGVHKTEEAMKLAQRIVVKLHHAFTNDAKKVEIYGDIDTKCRLFMY